MGLMNNMGTQKIRILIIKGHGGNDSGANANGLIERTMNKITAEAMYNFLINYSQLEVTLDNDNTAVDDEVILANAKNYDLIISVHYNAGGGDGFEAFYYSTNSNAKRLCQCIEARVKSIGQNSRGVKTGDSYRIIRKVGDLSIILEGGFIDNKADSTLFDSENEWKAFGAAYARGVLDYLGIKEISSSSNDTSSNKKVTYRVITGSFVNRDNANKRISNLKKAGFDSFLDVFTQ